MTKEYFEDKNLKNKDYTNDRLQKGEYENCSFSNCIFSNSGDYCSIREFAKEEKEE